jgi:cytochrome c-type biogenesis protein CcmH
VIRFLLLFFLVAGPAFAVSDPAELLADPRQEERAEDIGQQLRCLVCQNNSVEESESDYARDIRRVIRERVVAGDSDAQVIAWVTARYGDFVRLRPPFNALTIVLWGSPVLALLVGAAVVLLARRRHSVAPAPLSDAERRELKKLLDQ